MIKIKKSSIKPNNIRDIFNDYFNGQKNFMTPIILKYGCFNKKKYLYEVSTDHPRRLYGITIIEVIYNNDGYIGGIFHSCKLCKSFHSKKDLYQYLKDLKDNKGRLPLNKSKRGE